MHLMFKLGQLIARRKMRNNIKKLRLQGEHDIANKLEAQLKKDAKIKTPQDLIFQTKLTLVHQGRHEEALVWEAMAEKVARDMGVIGSDRELPGIPSGARQLGTAVAIWIISVVCGLAIGHMTSAPPDVPIEDWRGTQLVAGLTIGACLGLVLTILYVVRNVLLILKHHRKPLK